MLTLVNETTSRRAYAIRDFLSRNGYPFEWADAGQLEAVRAVLGVAEVEPSERDRPARAAGPEPRP